jgi:hypothetical protein
MTRFQAAASLAAAGFMLFIVDGVRERLDPVAATQSGLMATAEAAGSCAAPTVSALARTWTVSSASCNGTCQRTHFAVGDKLTFTQELAGRPAFSLAVRKASASGAYASTTGETLASDGVGNITGPIVLSQSPLDGTPIALYHLIVKVRSYDADGSGVCKLRARVAVCENEPAAGSANCSTQQADGHILLDP